MSTPTPEHSASASLSRQISGQWPLVRRMRPQLPPSRRRRRWDRRGYLFVVPVFVLFLLFVVTPVAYAIYLSLFTNKLIGGVHFSGLANYSAVLRSAEFWSGVERVCVFAVVQVPVTIVLATFFAVLFDFGLTRFGRTLRVVFFLPFTVPAAVAAVMWSFLLEPSFGPFTRLAATFGFSGTDYFSPNLIVPVIVMIVIWEVTGWNMIVIYTALKTVPREVMEAAVMDGAKLRQVVLWVKLPMVRSALIMLLFLNCVGALQLFTEPLMLATFQSQAVSDGFTPAIYIYNTAIASGQEDLAAAAAVVFALFILALSVISWAILRRRVAAP